MKKLVIFGAGSLAAQVISEHKTRKAFKLCFLVDNDNAKQEKYVNGLLVHAPLYLKSSEFDYILVLVDPIFMDAIISQLSSYGIDRKKIILCIGATNRYYCETILDKFFIINKKSPVSDFSYFPVKSKKNDYCGETFKSHDRREKEGFFEKYCKGKGLDICNGGDFISDDVCSWEIENGDAQYLKGIKNESFDYVYSSHGLEHMNNVRIALRNWFRVVKKGGFLIVTIPHRDLYEKKKTLPSRWNSDHRHMFLIGKEELPDTLDIAKEIRMALKKFEYDIKYIKTCDDGFSVHNPLKHSNGEYQIEFVIKRI